ncbi:prepilin peptidase [Actinophytocola sp. S1-96]|uniref:Prepilin peptidase n=1 Tax=Actinophytocola gossypii TaxID=2812003 RepID=A0ABT2J5U1_9PSEU|nr:prepilin peptidase [Actinophytocola gossypii]
MQFLTTALLALAGVLAGVAGRHLLARLRRGAVVHSGWLAAGVGVLWAVLGWRVSTGAIPSWWLPVPLVLTWFAVLLTATDLRHRRLPDALTLPAYAMVGVAAVVASLAGGGSRVVTSAFAGAVAYCVLHALVHLANPSALGAGDVKLSGSVGAVLGAVGWPAMMLGSVLAAVLTLVVRVMARHRWRDGVPYGPGTLAATSLIALFPGTALEAR